LWHNQDAIAAFEWLNGGKPWKSSVKISEVLAQNQTKHLMNISLECGRDENGRVYKEGNRMAEFTRKEVF
jgi:hypothetical protein